MQQCENALWWVLSLPDVADAVRRHADNVSVCVAVLLCHSCRRRGELSVA